MPMRLDRTSCYRALRARDRRFDGLFFTCVTSTGIYCRPICPARPPKLENCVFVPNAAAAQEAGFRACLRCRPDASPDSPTWRGTSATVTRALRLIDDGALDDGSVSDLAARLGVGERHLRRLFTDHLGAAPLTVALTRRILLAKQLVHDSNLGMMEIALASGFGSLRRFNEVFRAQFGRPPGALRKRADSSSKQSPELSVLLPYRPPYDWEAMLYFLQSRVIQGVEHVAFGVYRRTIEIDGEQGFISVSQEAKLNALRACIQIGNLSLVPRIVARLKRLFDVACDPDAIAAVLKRDARLAPLIARRPGLRVPGAWDGVEIGVRAILGQKMSDAAASLLAGRLVRDHGVSITAPSGSLTHSLPDADRLAQIDIDNAGIPKTRARAMAELAQALVAEPGLLEGGIAYQDVLSRLETINGIGRWTAIHIAMQALHESDAIPHGDEALARMAHKAGLSASPDALERLSENWRPWRAYGVHHLWAAEMDDSDDAAAA